MLFHGVELDSVSDNFRLPAPQKILITGGLGFIFSHVAEWFCQRGHEVHVLDNHSDGSHPRLVGPFLSQGIELHKCDVNDCAEYLLVSAKEIQYDYIIHAAAESNVDKSIIDSAPFYHSNIRGTIELLEWVRIAQENLKQFLYINTDEIYGSVYFPAYNKAPQYPSSPYSASKAAAGNICHSYRVTYKMPIKEFRICNVIGKRQANTKLVPRAIELITAGKEFPVYGNGSARREYIDVRLIGLIIEHFWMLCQKFPADRDGEEYAHNITTRDSRSIVDVLRAIGEVVQKQVNFGHGERPGHDYMYAMIPANWLDIIPKIPFNVTLDWIVNQEK